MTMTEEITDNRFNVLLNWGVLAHEDLRAAEVTAFARGVELEKVLVGEYRVPRHTLLKALSEYYKCPFVEYDEKLPVPAELLSSVDGERLSLSQWFPIIKDGGTVIIAANNPQDPQVLEEVKKYITAERYEFWVALGEDIQWFIQDTLHARPGLLIGTERTKLAFWRNTMAHWRTRLACYRTDLAKSRTDLAILRWGLGFIAIANTLMRTEGSTGRFVLLHYANWAMLTVGLSFALWGLLGYLKIRRYRMSPPKHQTLVEVTSATMHFLEDYHYIEDTGSYLPSKHTMLARTGDLLANHCTILYPSPASRERTHLARERNVLAAQRTVAGCYRTIYSRARTGLAFIRTGVSFASLGLGLMRYFGLSLFTVFDGLLIAAGLMMVADGLLWYLPVRKEQAEVPRCPVPQ